MIASRLATLNDVRIFMSAVGLIMLNVLASMSLLLPTSWTDSSGSDSFALKTIQSTLCWLILLLQTLSLTRLLFYSFLRILFFELQAQSSVLCIADRISAARLSKIS